MARGKPRRGTDISGPSPPQVADKAVRLAREEAARQRGNARLPEAELPPKPLALHGHLTALQAGGGSVRLDIYKLKPLPPDSRGRRVWLGARRLPRDRQPGA